jgi:hypothetical protein
MLNKIDHLEEDRERSNIVIFGLKEKGKEKYDDALDLVKKGLEESVRLVNLVSNIDHIASLQNE